MTVPRALSAITRRASERVAGRESKPRHASCWEKQGAREARPEFSSELNCETANDTESGQPWSSLAHG